MSGTDSSGGSSQEPGHGNAQPASRPPSAPTSSPGGGQGGGQGSWGYGQTGSPSPGGSSNSKALWIVLAAVVGIVVLVLGAVVTLVVVVGGEDEGSSTAGAKADGQARGGSASQPAVVLAYLTAVAEGDAEEALSLAAVDPLTKDFLTDDVLAESAKVAKITEIEVGEVPNEFTSSVPTTFKVGDQTVTQDFSVTKSGEKWKMTAAGSELDFTNMRKNTLPLLINGTSLDVDKVMLFPGAYSMTTGTDHISYGDLGLLTVKSTSDYLSTAELQPTLTPEGEKAYVAAVKASARNCLQKRELSPANCPNQASNDQYKLDKASIKWSQRGTDPYANLQPRLDYENPNLAVSRPSLQLEVKADCDSSSGRCDLRTYSPSEATSDLTKDPLTVQWVD